MTNPMKCTRGLLGVKSVCREDAYGPDSEPEVHEAKPKNC